MTAVEPIHLACALTAPGQVLLALDERPATLDRRFAALGLDTGPDLQAAYRELVLTTPGLEQTVSGIVLAGEALDQTAADGTPLPRLLARRALPWGVRADTAIVDLPGAPGETLTEGLDDLAPRLDHARALGARFARWRAEFSVGPARPDPLVVEANAAALALFAVAAQDQGLVPVLSLRLRRDGDHDLEPGAAATATVLATVIRHLELLRVDLGALVLGPTMALPGTGAARPAGPDDVAGATRRCLLATVPEAVAGIAFSTTGQSAAAADAHLSALIAGGALPWPVILSSGPTLQESVLRAWGGRPAGVGAAQAALTARLRCHQAASLGQWCDELEAVAAG